LSVIGPKTPSIAEWKYPRSASLACVYLMLWSGASSSSSEPNISKAPYVKSNKNDRNDACPRRNEVRHEEASACLIFRDEPEHHRAACARQHRVVEGRCVRRPTAADHRDDGGAEAQQRRCSPSRYSQAQR
jgi:hypothetical protein